MSNIQTGAERMPHDLSHLRFLAGPTLFPYTTLFRSVISITDDLNAGQSVFQATAVKKPTSAGGDRKSTRLNSSHPSISYAVFCLKKKTSVCRMTFPILASLLVRLVVLLPFQLLRLSLATPSRWTPLALSVFLHCVVALLLTLL